MDKENVYTYGLIQKYIEPQDERIMILMGASHITVLESLMAYSNSIQTIELKDIMTDY